MGKTSYMVRSTEFYQCTFGEREIAIRQNSCSGCVAMTPLEGSSDFPGRQSPDNFTQKCIKLDDRGNIDAFPWPVRMLDFRTQGDNIQTWDALLDGSAFDGCMYRG
jgi:hypothetical protein